MFSGITGKKRRLAKPEKCTKIAITARERFFDDLCGIQLDCALFWCFAAVPVVKLNGKQGVLCCSAQAQPALPPQR
jgi:hypothetical protein